MDKYGLAKERIHLELFSSAQPGRAKKRVIAAGEFLKGMPWKVTLGGETRTLTICSTESLLDAALNNNVDASFACRAGVCYTCVAKIVSHLTNKV